MKERKAVTHQKKGDEDDGGDRRITASLRRHRGWCCLGQEEKGMCRWFLQEWKGVLVKMKIGSRPREEKNELLVQNGDEVDDK